MRATEVSFHFHHNGDNYQITYERTPAQVGPRASKWQRSGTHWKLTMILRDGERIEKPPARRIPNQTNAKAELQAGFKLS